MLIARWDGDNAARPAGSCVALYFEFIQFAARVRQRPRHLRLTLFLQNVGARGFACRCKQICTADPECYRFYAGSGWGRDRVAWKGVCGICSQLAPRLISP